MHSARILLSIYPANVPANINLSVFQYRYAQNMSMNDGIKIDGARVQRRGRGSATYAGIGGVGIIGMIVYFLLTGQMPDSSTFQGTENNNVTSADGADYSEECRTGADANAHTECWMVATAESLDAYWADALPAQTGTAYSQPTFVIFDGATTTGCGNATASIGPFYCPADQTVYLDISFFNQLETQFNTENSTLAQAYIVAHEFGHHLQNELGYLDRIERGDTGANSTQVRSELQADCLAGVWLRQASTTIDPESGEPFLVPPTEAELQTAIDAASAVGDDAIMENAGLTVNTESFTHGSSEKRMQWLMRGYDGGSIASCDTWSVATS